MRRGRVPVTASFAVLLASVLTAASAAPAGAATGQTAFTCSQVSTSRAAYRQVISGTLDASGAPHDVLVTRLGVNEFGPVASPTLNNNPPFDYYKRTYGLDTWDLGARPSDNFGPRHGYLGIPSGQSNASGRTFNAYWTEEWLVGQGEWQKWFSCTLS